jgi:phosphate transport system substrate-binding protein
MNKRILIVMTLMIPCLWVQSAIAETLEIPGTGSCEVVLKYLASSFKVQNPGHEVIIPPSIGSKGGINAVITDKNLIARVNRPLEGDETKYGMKYLLFARDAVVFAIGEKVEIQNLTSSQLADIFSGKIDNWQQVGGNKAPIRALIRQPGETSLRIIQQHIKPFEQLTFTEQAKILYHDYEMVDFLAKYKMAIGWLTLSPIFMSKTIKPIALDNILPTPQNLLADKYKLVCDYALIYKENRLNELGKKFVDYIFSDSSKQIMKKYGLIPMERK